MSVHFFQCLFLLLHILLNMILSFIQLFSVSIQVLDFPIWIIFPSSSQIPYGQVQVYDTMIYNLVFPLISGTEL